MSSNLGSKVRDSVVRSIPNALLALLLLAAAYPARGADPIQSARSYLATRQLESGAFAGTRVVDTFEALAALPDRAAQETALVSLFLASPDNLEAAFLRATALAAAPYADPLAASALHDAIRRGELGLAPGSRGADPLVVAAALRFAVAEGSAADVVAVLDVLRSLRRADGSFGFADNESDLALTAEVVRVLAAPGVVGGSDLLAAARTWLRSSIPSGGTLPAADLALLLLALAPSDEAIAQASATELASRQDFLGAFDGGDTRATALAIQALALAMPDLVLRRPSIVLDVPTTGQPFAYPVVVANVGATTSAAAVIEYRVADGAGAVLFTSTAAVPPLSPAQQITVSLDLGTQGAPGARRLTAVANPAAAMVEGSYDNNVLTFDYRVADRPDLELVAGDISVSPVPPVVGGDTRVTVRVRNIGEALATNVHVQLFQGEPGAGGVLLGEQYFNAVANGTPRMFAASFVPRSKDPVRLFARVDPESVITEAREDNNSASIDVSAVNPADVVTDLSSYISASRTTASQGDPVTVAYKVTGTVKRYGSVYIDTTRYGFGALQVVLYLGTPGTLGVEVQRTWVGLEPMLLNLPGGVTPVGVASGQINYVLPPDLPAGRYRFTAVVDPENRSGDVNLTNNSASVDVELTNGGLAELYVAALTSDARIVDDAHPTTVRARIANVGQSAAAAVPVTLATPLRTIPSTAFAVLPGEQIDVSFALTAADLNPGLNTLTVSIDPQNLVTESSKLNNAKTLSVERTTGAVALTVRQLAPIPVSGEPARIELLVQNTGTRRRPHAQCRSGCTETGRGTSRPRTAPQSRRVARGATSCRWPRRGSPGPAASPHP